MRSSHDFAFSARLRPGRAVAFACLALAWTVPAAIRAADAPPPPNLVLIYADDLGYADLSCFGAEKIRTPHIDSLAADGTRFTHFYVSQAVCTASRAALMTGSHAVRVGLQGALNHESRIGISPDELLLPEIFKRRGYATGIFGKWHLGLQEPFLPCRNGFDVFAGIPYSNDNGPLHPIVRTIPALPWYVGNRVTERDPDQREFTRRLTEHACDFITDHRDRPFFLYLPHIMPHVPIHARDEFRGKSSAGLYGDTVQELDWSVGEILNTLKEHALDGRTWIVFTSDNGPFLSYGNHAGNAKPLREGKLTTFEGGMRTPCLMRWPGRIPAGRTCAEMVTALDFVPTVAHLLGEKTSGLPLDGKNVWPVLAGEPGARSPHEFFAYYSGEELQAVRGGHWKLHFPHDYLTVAGPPGRDGKPANFANLKPESMQESGVKGIASRHGYAVAHQPQALYHLLDDPGETRDRSAEHPEVVRRLAEWAETVREDLGDKIHARKGSGVRPVGKLPD